MTAWDLALDPTMATINQRWIWENGGGFSAFLRGDRTAVTDATSNTMERTQPDPARLSGAI